MPTSRKPKQERPQLENGFGWGHTLSPDDLQKGDVVVLQGVNVSYGGVSGNPIARLGPKNIVIVTEDRFGQHEYKVPRGDVVYAARGKVVHPVEYKGRSTPRRPWD